MSYHPLSYVPGNFDHPPASSSSDPGLPAHIQNLRRTLQREREIMRRQESARSERGPSAIPDAQDPRRRRYIRGAAASNTSLGSDTDGLRRRAPTRPMEPAGLSPNTAADAEWPTSDRRPTRDTPFRHTFNLRRLRQNHSDASAQLEMASERLGEAQSRLDALLRDPIMRSLSLSPSSSETRNTDGGAPQAKRRKVDHDARETFQGFHYGHFGQVIPGPLKMEIVSCDGGNYAEEDFPSVYGAENVLRNDGSVYCTQSSQCNLILRHQGETTFSLERLVIRAPEHSYTAPLQQGMIFVSMTSRDLIKQTQGYHLQYSSSPSEPPSLSDNHPGVGAALPSATTLSNIGVRLRDGSLPHQFGMPESSGSLNDAAENQRALSGEEQAPVWSRRYRGAGRFEATVGDSLVDQCETASLSSPSFRVTIETSTDSDEEYSQDPGHMAGWAEGAYELDNGDQRDSPYDGDRYRPSDHRRPAPRRLTQSRIEARSAREVQSSGAHLIPPHATFFIEKNKSKIAIKFDPPVSGKFILLKLWSPRRDDNIDIQSIVAHGYAGTRYFPSVQMR